MTPRRKLEMCQYLALTPFPLRCEGGLVVTEKNDVAKQDSIKESKRVNYRSLLQVVDLG